MLSLLFLDFDWEGKGGRSALLLEHAQDVAFLHDQQVLAVDLDLGARPLAEQDAVAGLHVQRLDLAVFVVARAGADGDDFAFLRLFLGGVGDDDPALGLFFFLDALDEDAVSQGTKPRAEAAPGPLRRPNVVNLS
jgi:hypothetical protein